MLMILTAEGGKYEDERRMLEESDQVSSQRVGGKNPSFFALVVNGK